MQGYFAQRYASDRVDDAEAWCAGEYGHVAFGRGFRRLEQRGAGDGRFTVARTAARGAFRTDVAVDRVVVVASSRPYRWRTGRDGGDAALEPALFQPGPRYAVEVDGSDCLTATFAVPELERTARLLYADDDLRLRFDGSRPLSPQLGGYWRSTVALAVEHAHTGALESDLLRTSVYRTLAVAALEAFRLQGDRPRRRVSAERSLRVFREASRYLVDHAHRPITVEDAAQAIGSSTHELTTAFRAHDPEQRAPAAYLGRVRLAGAHAELLEADAQDVFAIERIAREWGFADAGALATRCREVYGSVPVPVAVA